MVGNAKYEELLVQLPCLARPVYNLSALPVGSNAVVKDENARAAAFDMLHLASTELGRHFYYPDGRTDPPTKVKVCSVCTNMHRS